MASEQIVEDLIGDLRKLSNKIRNRKRFLDKIVEPVMDLVSKKGEVLSYGEHSCHTHIVSELRNFGHFSFRTDLGQTMFGGNTVTIYYHPGRKFLEGGIDSAHDKDWNPVLKVDFQVDTEYEVKKFDEQKKWQRALVYVLKNKDRISEKVEKAKTTVTKSRTIIERNKKLREEARKLGITL